MEPTPSRPQLPRGYGVEKATGAPGERLPWSRVSEWLTAARNYWVCTTRPDGRPHAKPVWAVWLEDQLLFSTHPESITARNLRANPVLVVHPESGDDVAIVDGTARRLDDRALLARFGAAYEAKYDWHLSGEDLDPANPGAAYYAVQPRVVVSWATEAEIGETITRWSFDRPGWA
ncbi:MAG TPA: pyridoxamine 5'-phosphate oxidase family protein [Thermoleophilaceae bacterium]|nr:pyridoxamine 5'-phosphate oxidase family protein [Thermoleophilaceae bacterium]